jgi:hypothetical protein
MIYQSDLELCIGGCFVFGLLIIIFSAIGLIYGIFFEYSQDTIFTSIFMLILGVFVMLVIPLSIIHEIFKKGADDIV